MKSSGNVETVWISSNKPCSLSYENTMSSELNSAFTYANLPSFEKRMCLGPDPGLTCISLCNSRVWLRKLYKAIVSVPKSTTVTYFPSGLNQQNGHVPSPVLLR